jgi:hypothetical protein
VLLPRKVRSVTGAAPGTNLALLVAAAIILSWAMAIGRADLTGAASQLLIVSAFLTGLVGAGTT